MKVLFIYPAIHPAYPLQIGALSAYIKREGHKTKLVRFDSGSSVKISFETRSLLEREIKEFKPDLVAFSCYEMSFTVTKNICRFVKCRWPELKIIVGGYFPTLVPEAAIKYSGIDIICRGEGEQPLVELLASMKAGKDNFKIKNLWFKKGKKIIRNPVRPLMTDLDMLPFPDRDMLDYQKHIDLEKKGSRNVKVMALRGCPYQCTYCSNTGLRAVYPNPEHYLRFRNPKNVIKELKKLKTRYEFDSVGFHDDNFTLNSTWLKAFMKLYRKEIKMPFYCAARVETCSEATLQILKDAGCYMMLFGVESGDEKYRKEMLQRHMSNELLIKVFRRVRELGMLTWSFTMVGLPYETKLMILKTIWLNWRCRPDMIMSSVFYPIRGTVLGDLCYKEKRINLKKRRTVFSISLESILDHPNLSPFEIKAAKYCNLIPGCRSRHFWSIVFQRIREGIIPPKMISLENQ